MSWPPRCKHRCGFSTAVERLGSRRGRHGGRALHEIARAWRHARFAPNPIAAGPDPDAPETVTPRRTETDQSVSVLLQRRRQATIAIPAIEHPARQGPRTPAVTVCPCHALRKPRNGEPARRRYRRPPAPTRRHLLSKPCRADRSATPSRAGKRSKKNNRSQSPAVSRCADDSPGAPPSGGVAGHRDRQGSSSGSGTRRRRGHRNQHRHRRDRMPVFALPRQRRTERRAPLPLCDDGQPGRQRPACVPLIGIGTEPCIVAPGFRHAAVHSTKTRDTLPALSPSTRLRDQHEDHGTDSPPRARRTGTRCGDGPRGRTAEH